MKKPIKTLSAVISLFVLGSSVAGCSRGGDEVKINHDMSQLYVGFGFSDDSFLPQLAKEFEEAYKDVEFEPGKKGVQVFINSNGKFSETGTIYSNLSSYQEEIVIAEQLELNRLVKQNLVAEITDAVKTPISSNAYSEKVDLGETQSIEDKMADAYKDYYGKDGKYYAVPYTESTIGIIYDVDLFDKEGLYFARAGKGNSDGFVEEEYTVDDLSAGPDGEYGTYDDGLPATYDDYFRLCKYMQLEFAITPVIWGGKVQTYPVTFMTSLYADYEGERQMRLNYDFNGTANDLVCVENGKVQYNADGTLKTYSTAISASNGYELYKQSGRYYALSFLERLVNSEYYNSGDCFGGTVDHLTAQGKFLLSKAKNEPTAMLIDGTWWQSEARKSNVFSDMAEKYGSQYALENRNFAFMPLPKATSDKVGEKQTTMMFIDSMAFVNGNVKAEKKALCELFLKYMHTRQSLLQYIQVTGQMKPFEIELTQEEYNGLTGFGKSSYNIHKYTNLLLPLSYNDVFCTAKYLFSPNGMQVWQSANGEIVTSMIKNDGITAEQHFLDIINYRSAVKWDEYFKGVCY
ncbi:MAG: hypothetical protein SPH68_02230 [Candidatus Borkfalkiaceae bacterium]|nr:hypothetical protein [Clostridia bacterium]MDY6222963.1 hypothetical protein [Christensenellaceae bacterium]